MSNYEQKDNEGMLSRNDDKREGKQDSDFRGTAMIGGVEYWINGWVNESKTKKNPDGSPKKYFKLKFNKKQSGGTSSQSRQQEPPPDDDVPF